MGLKSEIYIHNVLLLMSILKLNCFFHILIIWHKGKPEFTLKMSKAGNKSKLEFSAKVNRSSPCELEFSSQFLAGLWSSH